MFTKRFANFENENEFPLLFTHVAGIMRAVVFGALLHPYLSILLAFVVPVKVHNKL